LRSQEKASVTRRIECILFKLKVVFFPNMKLKFLVLILFLGTFLGFGLVAEAKSTDTISESRYNKVCRWGILNPPECKKRIIKTRTNNSKNTTNTSKQATTARESTYKKKTAPASGCGWGIFNPPKCRGKDSIAKNKTRNESYKEESQNLSFYTGVFDYKDEKGIGETKDDKTSLVGIEHKNKDLFRNTWLGKFSPTTGGFVTKKSSVYLYSGVEVDYNLGPINISPSFAPGYYQAGDGKNLGSALEFKSEVKIGLDLFKDSNLGYSYSHISNNDWGDVNPGTDNQSITFSKKF
jgi:lipid A 3-O-deacylase